MIVTKIFLNILEYQIEMRKCKILRGILYSNCQITSTYYCLHKITATFLALHKRKEPIFNIGAARYFVKRLTCKIWPAKYLACKLSINIYLHHVRVRGRAGNSLIKNSKCSLQTNVKLVVVVVSFFLFLQFKINIKDKY